MAYVAEDQGANHRLRFRLTGREGGVLHTLNQTLALVGAMNSTVRTKISSTECTSQ